MHALCGGPLGTNVERGRDFREFAAHQYGRGHPYHLIEGPCQVRRICEIGGVCGSRNRSLRRNCHHSSGQLAPQHVTAKREPDLFFEQVSKAAWRKKRLLRRTSGDYRMKMRIKVVPTVTPWLNR